MSSRYRILDGSAEDALRWLEGIQAGRIEVPAEFDWALLHQLCRDYIRGYYLERFHSPRPDLQPVADKIEQIMRMNGTWEE